MPKISEMQVSLGRTINLGNYETARIDVQMTARLEEGDEVKEVYESLYNTVNRQVLKELRKLKPEDYE